jgi:lipopolysaccharide transport system ATP-binding protein
MSDAIITVEGLSKRYRLGQIGATTLRDTVERWTSRLRRQVPTASSPQPSTSHVPPSTSSRDDLWALKDVSFEVKRGEVLGIIGRNGAGKSTLLKILSRITEPTSGRAILRGRVASLLEVGTGFHPELTGRENIYLNGAILGMKKAEITRKFDEIVAFAEVEKFIDTPVKRYSSGMYVRLAFAVAAHLDPEILLVDEVLAVGDAAFQQKCLGKMGEVAQSGRTVLFVSHNTVAVLELCSRCIWVDQGGVKGDGDAVTQVGEYLALHGIPLGSVSFSADKGSHGVALTRASVLDETGGVCCAVSYEKTFCVQLQYEVREYVDGLRIGFRLFNSRNQPIFHSSTLDSRSVSAMVGRLGHHCISARVPSCFLPPGRYHVEIGAWSPKVKHHQHVPSAFAFDVRGCSIVDSGVDVVRPMLMWEHE